MPVGVDVELLGVQRLARDLRKLDRKLVERSAMNQDAANIYGRRGQQDAPRASGKLAASLRPKGLRTKAVVRSYVRYAGAVHWGNPKRGVKARPFLYDAVPATRPQWLASYQRAVEALLRKIKGV